MSLGLVEESLRSQNQPCSRPPPPVASTFPSCGSFLVVPKSNCLLLGVAKREKRDKERKTEQGKDRKQHDEKKRKNEVFFF